MLNQFLAILNGFCVNKVNMTILPSDKTARFEVYLGSIIALIAALTLAYLVDFENQNFKWTIVIGPPIT